MASEKQNPAGANGEACDSSHLDNRDTQQDTATGQKLQDKVVGSIPRNKREEIRIALRTFNEDRLCDIRIFKDIHGADTSTNHGVTFRPTATNIRKAIDGLELLEAAAKAEGLLT